MQQRQQLQSSPPQLSFDCTAAAGGALLPRRLVHDAAGNAFLPWCGLLVNTATLEMQVPFQQRRAARPIICCS